MKERLANAGGGRGRAELLAPAGDIGSAYAAFQFGADAVYLGLKRFSARAEAVNFTPDELSEITGFAHAANPRRRVFVTINTLVLDRELDDLVETLGLLTEIGVDAVIAQDLGVVHVARKYFPGLALHASTQMAIHDLAGAQTAKTMGFKRVTLARELTLDEVRRIVSRAGLEIEVFVHGALCYSYSGLCLFSSMLRGRSGNRGRCTYPCRNLFKNETPDSQRPHGEPSRERQRTEPDDECFPFSMKDLAAADDITALRDAGVASFKIEGRKKSDLYVACTTAYYHGLLAGKLSVKAQQEAEADIKTVFSRRWTRLYLRSSDDRDVADRDTVGHRGAPAGTVEAIYGPGTRSARLRFKSLRALELHDGLQIDVEGGKPFGFAVDRLWIFKNGPRDVFKAATGSVVEVTIPPQHPPITPGMTIYCASSQAVKQKYTYDRPRPGVFRIRHPVNISVEVEAALIVASGETRLDGPTGAPVRASVSEHGDFAVSRTPVSQETAAHSAFEKLGNTGFRLGSFVLRNTDGHFVPVSTLNRLRRELTSELESALDGARKALAAKVRSALKSESPPGIVRAGQHAVEWTVRTAGTAALDTFTAADWHGVAEVVVDIGIEPVPRLRDGLASLSAAVGRERIRLALPLIIRSWEEDQLRARVGSLTGDGWMKWEATNLSAWTYLSARQTPGDGHTPLRYDLATDWSVYVLNRAAALQVMEMGATCFVVSPEAGFEDIRELLAEFGARATVIVYQDTPLFISETCPRANIKGRCAPGNTRCKDWRLDQVSAGGEEVSVISSNCRTVTVGRRPFSLIPFLDQLKAAVSSQGSAGVPSLRADLSWLPRPADEVRDIWRSLREGKGPAGHSGNWKRGLV